MSENATEVKAKTIKLLAEQEIKDSMADAKFYEAMPEFLPLHKKMQAIHEDPLTPHGCTNCQKNRLYRSLSGDYLRIVQNLKDGAAERLRKYFGADELRANVLDPVTQQPKTIKI